jgi:uncharacterized protein YkwD
MNKLIILLLISFAASSVVELEEVRNQLLERHNYYRAKHGVDNLVRNSELEEISQEYTSYLVTNNLFEHSNNMYNSDYMGENLYQGTLMSNIGESCTDLWYSEISDYDYNNPVFGYDTGHFTQVVWKDTKQMGCGFECSNNYCTITCNYYPAGNYVGEFAKNVLPLTDSVENEETNSDETNTDETSTDETNTDETNTNEESSSENTEETADTELTQFRQDIVSWHNHYRALHQVGDLEEDSELNRIAQETAEYMASIDNFSFSSDTYNGNYFGQSAFFSYNTPSGKGITTMFYNGVSSYDFSNPGYSQTTGGFTQLVWKDTTKIGAGFSCNSQNKCYGLITYYPAGNYAGEFEENVFPQN